MLITRMEIKEHLLTQNINTGSKGQKGQCANLRMIPPIRESTYTMHASNSESGDISHPVIAPIKQGTN